MTLATLRADVLAQLGVPSSDAFYTTTKLNQLINAALQYASSLGDWEWLESSETISTASGTDSYPVSATALRTIDIVDPSGVTLARKPLDELLYMPGGGAQSAYVRYFANFKNTLIVRPVPNTTIALKHYFVVAEPALASDGDVPLMAAAYQQCIVDRAVYRAQMSAGNEDAANAANKSFEDWITAMLARADRRANTTGGGSPPGPTAAPPTGGS